MNAHADGSDLSAYLDGALAPEPRARVELHMSSCAECRAEVMGALVADGAVRGGLLRGGLLRGDPGADAAHVGGGQRRARERHLRPARRSGEELRVDEARVGPLGIGERADALLRRDSDHA